ncbi:hypothetical protein ES703_35409 [subsurface metagenome]
MGFAFLAAPVEISIDCIVGSWTLVDLSGYGVPSNATGAIIRYTGGDAKVDGITFRKPGGSGSGAGTDQLPAGHGWTVAPVVNQELEVYREHSAISVYLWGWTTSDVMFLDTPPKKTPAVGDSWEDVDCSSECPGAIGIIYEIEDMNGWFYGVRKKGSGDGYDSASWHRWGIIGCDSNQVFQCYMALFGEVIITELFIVGYITQGTAGLFTNRQEITPGVTGSWEEVDISAYLTGKNAAFIHVTSDLASKAWGLRPTGSSEEPYRYVLQQQFGIVEVDADNKFEAKIEDSNVHLYLLGGDGLVKPKSQGHIIG